MGSIGLEEFPAYFRLLEEFAYYLILQIFYGGQKDWTLKFIIFEVCFFLVM